MTRSIKISIDHEGWLLVIIFACISLIGWWIWSPLGIIGGILTAWCCYFFRDPDRMVPQDEDLILSPADGAVCDVHLITPPEDWGMEQGPRWRVSIFLNVFDVHVNRIPCNGRVKFMKYSPGKFINAALSKASEDNERQVIVLACTSPRESAQSYDVGLVQIAGLIARRIRTDIIPDQNVIAGERFGIIRFGSRVDIYLPSNVVPLVIQGQRVIAGETIIADLSRNHTALPVAILK